MSEEIIAGNKLISEFMGFRYSKSGRTVRKGPYDSPYRLKDIRYNVSYDWLMPVAKKIIELPPLSGKVISHINQMESVVSALMTADICKIYFACIDFITWYNTQQQNNGK